MLISIYEIKRCEDLKRYIYCEVYSSRTEHVYIKAINCTLLCSVVWHGSQIFYNDNFC